MMSGQFFGFVVKKLITCSPCGYEVPCSAQPGGKRVSVKEVLWTAPPVWVRPAAQHSPLVSKSTGKVPDGQGVIAAAQEELIRTFRSNSQ